MSNHVHLLVGTPRGNLGKFLGWWQTAYAAYFNRKYRRHGHLTQDRYGAKLVEGDEYLMKLSRYIHLNPVTTTEWKETSLTERVEGLQRFRWSSFPGYCFAGKAQAFVRYEPLLELVGRARSDLRRYYRRYVESGLAESPDEWEALQSQSRLAIGSSDFIASVNAMYGDLVTGHSHPQDVSLRRVGNIAPPSVVLRAVANEFGLSVTEVRQRRRHAEDRTVAAYLLVTKSGLTQREAARHLQVKSGTATGAQLQAYRTRYSTSAGLRATMKRIEKILGNERS